MAHNAYLVDTNPNDIHGGGGDIAGPEHDKDSIGPWVVWPAQEFESIASPVACVSFGAFLTMAKLFRKAEVLGGAEDARVPAGSAIMLLKEQDSESPAPWRRAESATFNLDDPEEREAFLKAMGGDRVA